MEDEVVRPRMNRNSKQNLPRLISYFISRLRSVGVKLDSSRYVGTDLSKRNIWRNMRRGHHESIHTDPNLPEGTLDSLSLQLDVRHYTPFLLDFFETNHVTNKGRSPRAPVEIDDLWLNLYNPLFNVAGHEAIFISAQVNSYGAVPEFESSLFTKWSASQLDYLLDENGKLEVLSGENQRDPVQIIDTAIDIYTNYFEKEAKK